MKICFAMSSENVFFSHKTLQKHLKTPNYMVMSTQKIINAPTNEEIKFEKIHFSIVKLRLNAI